MSYSSFLSYNCLNYVLQSSFQAEEASQLPDTATFDEAKSQRIQHLEHLLKDFKATNDQLQRELDTLGGEAAATSQQRSRELEEELAAERSAREEADRGTTVSICLFFSAITDKYGSDSVGRCRGGI
jgi:hypothetical protein